MRLWQVHFEKLQSEFFTVNAKSAPRVKYAGALCVINALHLPSVLLHMQSEAGHQKCRCIKLMCGTVDGIREWVGAGICAVCFMRKTDRTFFAGSETPLSGKLFENGLIKLGRILKEVFLCNVGLHCIGHQKFYRHKLK